LRGSRDPGGWQGGATLGAILGIGVWAANLLEIDAYAMHPLGLWAIDGGYGVIGMAIVGGIIGGWRRRI